MRSMLSLTRRNIRMFVRNRLNILLSFASVFIIMGIYILFLRDFMMDAVTRHGVLPELADIFTDRFMTGGLLVVVSTTTCFGMVQVFVADAASGIKRDFLVSPATPFQLTMGYLLSSTLVSSFFTCFTAVGLACFFSLHYGSVFPLSAVLQICGAVFYSGCLNSMILLCLSRFLKSTATFSTLANLYGTLIGFLAGTYLPCYFYPDWLRHLLFYFPPAQMNSILRQLFTQNMKEVTGGASPDFTEKLFLDFGIYLERGGQTCRPGAQWRLLLIAGLLLVAVLWLLNRKYRSRKKPPRRKGFIYFIPMK